MHSFKLFFAAGFLVAMPACANASSVPMASFNAETMFPPANCVSNSPTQTNIIIWDGASSMHCLPIPICTGSGQLLSFDGMTVTCIPTGDGGIPTAEPAIPTHVAQGGP